MDNFEGSCMHTISHEACHAAIALSLDQIVSLVWLEPKNNGGGIVHAGMQDPSLDNARVAMAGVVYEWRRTGSLKSPRSRQDVHDAWWSLRLDRDELNHRVRSRAEREAMFKKIFYEVNNRLERFGPYIEYLKAEFSKRLLTPDLQNRKKKRHWFGWNWNARMKKIHPGLRF